MGFISSAWHIREQTWKHLRQCRRAGERARHAGPLGTLGVGQALSIGDGGDSLGDGDKAEDIQRQSAFSRAGRIRAR